MSDVDDLLRSLDRPPTAEASVTVRPLYPGEEHAAQALVSRCHPGWPERPLIWFFAHPSLVALDAAGTLIGLTAFAIDQTNSIMHLGVLLILATATPAAALTIEERAAACAARSGAWLLPNWSGLGFCFGIRRVP